MHLERVEHRADRCVHAFDHGDIGLACALHPLLGSRHRIVAATQTSVLKSKGVEQLALQACHPRYFASHRYIAYAKPVGITPPATGTEALG